MEKEITVIIFEDGKLKKVITSEGYDVEGDFQYDLRDALNDLNLLPY